VQGATAFPENAAYNPTIRVVENTACTVDGLRTVFGEPVATYTLSAPDLDAILQNAARGEGNHAIQHSFYRMSGRRFQW
jgi:hypothetical protein